MTRDERPSWQDMTSATPLSEADVPVMLGALLVRVARADHEYLAIEAAVIEEILALRFGLNPEDAHALRRRSDALESAAPETARFAKALRDLVPYDTRLATALTLWDVMMADGLSRPEEQAVIALAEEILGVHSEDLTRSPKGDRDA